MKGYWIFYRIYHILFIVFKAISRLEDREAYKKRNIQWANKSGDSLNLGIAFLIAFVSLSVNIPLLVAS